jgi:hypothetical protein
MMFGLLVVAPLFFISNAHAAVALTSLALGTCAFVLTAGLTTLLKAPDVALARFMVHPLTGEEVNSTGQINAFALAAGFLLLPARRSILGWLAVVAMGFLAIAYLNRTGMVLSAFLILGWTLCDRHDLARRIYITLALVVSAFTATIFLHPDTASALSEAALLRFQSDGLESERFRLQRFGLDLVLAGEHALGGGDVTRVGVDLWYHNLFLDAYRVAGLPGMLLFVLLTIWAFQGALQVRRLPLLVLLSATLLACLSSIPVEGSLVEYCSVFPLLAYAVLLGQAANPQGLPFRPTKLHRPMSTRPNQVEGDRLKGGDAS